MTSPPTWLQWMPLLIMLAFIPISIITPSFIVPAIILASLAPITALANGPLVTGLVSVAIIVLQANISLVFATRFYVQELPTTIAVCAMSVLMAALRVQYSSRLVQARDIAAAAQSAILPRIPPTVGMVDCDALYHAAQQEALVGGDLFDVQDTAFGVRVIVGDVKGHGLDAVATVAALIGTFREAVLDDVNLTQIGARLERRMDWDNKGRSDWAASFATALLLEFTPGARHIRILTFGHPAPFLVRDGEVRELSLTPNPPLGLSDKLSSSGRMRTVGVQHGDLIVGFTDGVIETRNIHGEFYPLMERFKDMLQNNRHPNPNETTTFIWEDLNRFSNDRRDDIAILALEVKAPHHRKRRRTSPTALPQRRPSQ